MSFASQLRLCWSATGLIRFAAEQDLVAIHHVECRKGNGIHTAPALLLQHGSFHAIHGEQAHSDSEQDQRPGDEQYQFVLCGQDHRSSQGWLPRRAPASPVAPIRRSLSNILFFGKEYALRTWKGNPIHFPFHADAWKRPHPKTRAPEHIGIYCPCTQVSNSDDSLSGVLESRVRFFRLALLPLPFHCRMVGENGAKEIGRFPSFRNISALSVELLRSRGICGTTGTRSERDAGTPGVRCPALPGDGPGRTCPGALMKRRHRSRKEWRGGMARLDRFSVYCPCRRMVLFPQTDGGKRTCGEGRGRTEERSAFLLGRGALRAGRG